MGRLCRRYACCPALRGNSTLFFVKSQPSNNFCNAIDGRGWEGPAHGCLDLMTRILLIVLGNARPFDVVSIGEACQATVSRVVVESQRVAPISVWADNRAGTTMPAVASRIKDHHAIEERLDDLRWRSRLCFAVGLYLL